LPRIEGTKVGVDGKGREVWSPIVVVRMSLPSASASGPAVSGPAIVDSGADVTMIPAEAVAAIGIDWKKLPAGTHGGGAGGQFESRPLQLTVSWQSWKTTEEIRIAEPGRLPVVLLGRCDFFRDFVVRFHWHKAPPEFHLDPVAAPRKR
jgi:hypothetical protein